jgi:hypothetical protein
VYVEMMMRAKVVVEVVVVSLWDLGLWDLKRIKVEGGGMWTVVVDILDYTGTGWLLTSQLVKQVQVQLLAVSTLAVSSCSCYVYHHSKI